MFLGNDKMFDIYRLMISAICTAITYPVEELLLTIVDSAQRVLADVFAGLFNR